MKNPPQELTKKWFKANVPDKKETKKLKDMVDKSDKYLLTFSLPGDIDLSEIKGFIGLLGQISAEAKGLEKNATLDAKAKARLVGYSSACKVAQNYFATVLKERDANAAQARQTDASSSAAAKSADAELMAMNKSLKDAEQMVPALVSRVQALPAMLQKAANDADRAKLKADTKKVFDAAEKKVLATSSGTWEARWQILRQKAGPENFPFDMPTANKYRAKLDEISKRIVQIMQLRDAMRKKYAEVMT